jgi:hypothetical protein
MEPAHDKPRPSALSGMSTDLRGVQERATASQPEQSECTNCF